MPKRTSWLLGYGTAIAAVLLATLVRQLLDPVLGERSPFVTYFAALLFTTWYGGTGPSLLAMLLGALFGTYFFASPRGSLVIPEPEHHVGLGTYGFVGIVSILLSEAIRGARQRAEESARQAREERNWLRVALTNIGDAVITTDHRGMITFLNPVAEQLTGWTLLEASNQPLEAVFRVVNEETRQPIGNLTPGTRQQAVRALAEHTLLLARDGTERAIDASAAPIQDAQGNLNGFLLVFRDVTSRRQKERETRKWASIFQYTQNGVAISNADLTCLEMVNEGFARMFGYRLEELAGRNLKEFTTPECHPAWAEHAKRMQETGFHAFESKCLRKDGSVFPVWIGTTAVRDEQGNILFRAIHIQDITQQKQAEERFRLLSEIIPQLVWSSLPDGSIDYCNPRWLAYTGLTQEQAQGDGWTTILHPEDSASTRQTWKQATDSGQPYQAEYRLRSKEGLYHWFLTRALPLRDENGQVVKWYGTCTDISARKEMEQSLHLQAKVLANMTEGVCLLDEAGNILYTNPAEDRMFGYEPGELVGQHVTIQIASPPEQKAQIVAGVVERLKIEPVGSDLASLGSERTWIGEFNNRKKDGSLFTTNARITALELDGKRHWLCVQEDITERRRAEQTLERYRLLSEHARDIVLFIRPDGQIVEANAAAITAYGYDRDTLLSMTVHQLRAEPGVGLIPDQLFQANHVGITFEAIHRRCDGSTFPVEVSARGADVGGTWRAPAGDSGQERLVLSIIRDITERKKIETHARFLAETGSAVAALVDPESTLQAVASLAVPTFADWCLIDMIQEDNSLRRVAVVHAGTNEIPRVQDFPPEQVARVLEASEPQNLSQILESKVGSSSVDSLLISPPFGQQSVSSSQQVFESYLCVLLRVREKAVGVMTFATAESGRRYDSQDLAVAEELARRTSIALENARLYTEAREADRRKDEFLAMLAHELRNPLAPIRNALQILKMPGANASLTTQARAMMDRQVQQLVRLVDDLLDVSRIMRGKIQLRKERIDIHSIVTRAVETAQPLIDAGGHALVLDLPPEPIWLEGDVVRLAQVISNLLNNAAKYTEKSGRIWLSVTGVSPHGGSSPERSETRAERDPSGARPEPTGSTLGGLARDWDNRLGVEVHVRDNGVGIAPEILPQIFDLFVQADRSLARSQGGLGIGLTVVRSLVEMHGGSVKVFSEGVGKGSEFVVRLPTLSAEKLPSLPIEKAEPPRGPSRRVLIVDDNADAADSLGMVLRVAGHEVEVAYDGLSGLQAALSHRPNFVFLDLGMPGMDGYEVARRLRQQPGLENVYLTALTGWGQEEDRRLTQAAGFDFHLVKPVLPETLRDLIANSTRGKGE